MVNFIQSAVLAGIILIGSLLGFWMRRMNMSGFELWLAATIIISYAVSPLAGFLTGFLIIAISFALHPFHMSNIVIMTIGIAGISFATNFIAITETTLVPIALLMIGIYMIFSAIIGMFTGYPLSRSAKFIMLSLIFNYLIFNYAGWRILTYIQGLA